DHASRPAGPPTPTAQPPADPPLGNRSIPGRLIESGYMCVPPVAGQSGLGRGREVLSSLPGQLASERHPVARAHPGAQGRRGAGPVRRGSSRFRELSNLGSFLFDALLKILKILLIRSLDPD